jgi:hypothetical protein
MKHPTWREIRERYLFDPEVRQAFEQLQVPERTSLPTPADFGEAEEPLTPV